MIAGCREEPIRQGRTDGETNDAEMDDQDAMTTRLAAVDTRRNVLRRSLLGLTGVGLTALVTGCGWGGDEEDDDSDVLDEPSDGLEGGEDPGEDPGIDEESGINEDDLVVGDPDDNAEEAEDPDE